MGSRAVLPVVAAFVAVADTVSRWIVPLAIELSVDIPSPELLSIVANGGRLVAVVLVYGLLFGVAYSTGDGSPHDGVGDLTSVALLSGVVAGVVALGGSAAVAIGIGDGPLAAQIVGAVTFTVVTVVQFSVVTFAGLALARLRGGEGSESSTRTV